MVCQKLYSCVLFNFSAKSAKILWAKAIFNPKFKPHGRRHFGSIGCRPVNKVPLTTMINTRTSKNRKKYSGVSQLLETHSKLKLIFWIFIFFSFYHSSSIDFLRYFFSQKIIPKMQSSSPPPCWKMDAYTSRKIAHFQAPISSKLHSAGSWHSPCLPKPVFSTNCQVHGPQNPLLYREFECIQIVIRSADAILGLFTGLHPLKPQEIFVSPKNTPDARRKIPFLHSIPKMKKQSVSGQ